MVLAILTLCLDTLNCNRGRTLAHSLRQLQMLAYIHLDTNVALQCKHHHYRMMICCIPRKKYWIALWITKISWTSYRIHPWVAALQNRYLSNQFEPTPFQLRYIVNWISYLNNLIRFNVRIFRIFYESIALKSNRTLHTP